MSDFTYEEFRKTFPHPNTFEPDFSDLPELTDEMLAGGVVRDRKDERLRALAHEGANKLLRQTPYSEYEDVLYALLRKVAG